MNAIKRPVEAYRHDDGMWRVTDARGFVIGQIWSGDEAREIALSLNCHDALVTALAGVVRVADRKTVEFDAARAALAKVEDLRKNQQQPTTQNK